ncbi:hypothetical protein P154DRAFT_524296 [Amniculicola lignicola CBS 123094]|uniref:Mid2 domain-containing protein n=1 Tax=Amniculicola lignicola CBS 123094 TaxID=1392246 RepID=A0A6A5W889_9PLEO|nr:hypothetical protein P154DRAFT_524296 [Amniculicola lignicola CBS 123094]
MGPLAGPSKLSRISLPLPLPLLPLLVLLVLLPTAHAVEIFSRQAPTCGGNTNLVQCGNGFPTDFCCSGTSKCMPLNASSGTVSVICCPKNSDCALINPIPCDVSQYNATLHPENQMHLSNLQNVKLPVCGQKCCPPGYKCEGEMCTVDAPSPSASASASPSASSTSPTAPAAASQTAASTPAPVVQSQSGFDGKSFAAGLFPGIIIGALLALGLQWSIKKRRETQKDRFSGDFGHVHATISDPIYNPSLGHRTDFIRRGSGTGSGEPSPSSTTGMVQARSEPQRGGGMTPRIKSLWARSPKLGMGSLGSSSSSNTRSPVKLGLPVNPARPPPAIRAGSNNNKDPYTTPTRTPKRTTSRSSRSSRRVRPVTTRSTSTETIDVLMPAPSFLEPPRMPGMREQRMTQDSTHTTFTKLMERAGYDGETRDEVRAWPGHAR